MMANRMPSARVSRQFPGQLNLSSFEMFRYDGWRSSCTVDECEARPEEAASVYGWVHYETEEVLVDEDVRMSTGTLLAGGG
jgi:hypothetical protein